VTLDEASSRVNLDTQAIAYALASYVRSILSGDSPYDRFVSGDGTALSPEQQRGLQLFCGKGNCTACHVGPTFSDEKLHNTGIAWAALAGQAGGAGTAGSFRDEGYAAISGKAEDRGAFKTPTLREVARTAPYMHDGSIARLEDVVLFYDAGGRANPNLDPELRPLHLSDAEKSSLIAFLQSLSGTVVEGFGGAR
jgi:cytochrome c peroxidase